MSAAEKKEKRVTVIAGLTKNITQMKPNFAIYFFFKRGTYMRTNNIIKNHLETRAKELKRDGKTLEAIAQILTAESKNRISLSSVFRFFDFAELPIEKCDMIATSNQEIRETDNKTKVNALLNPYFIARGADNRNACAFVRFVKRKDKALAACSDSEIESMFINHIEKIVL